MVYVFFADGFEEIEALTVIDLVRRSGAEIQMVSITGDRRVCGSHGIAIEADLLWEEMQEDAEILVLPGGMPGTKHLKECADLAELLKKQYEAGKWIAAICAAPSVFAGLGFLKDRKATSYPGWFQEGDCAEYLEEEVVVDGNVVTSRGLGTAIPFALKLVEILKGKEVSEQIATSVIYRQ